jgi:hypothetical protein
MPPTKFIASTAPGRPTAVARPLPARQASLAGPALAGTRPGRGGGGCDRAGGSSDAILARRAPRPDLATHATPSPSSSTTPPPSSSTSSADDADYLALKNVTVLRATDGEAVPLASTFRAGPSDRTLLFVLTHAADLAPWELVPRVVAALPKLREAGVQVIFVVLGTPANAAVLAERLAIPPSLLFADPTGATHDALRFSRGFDPAGPVKLNPYVRLLAMLAGIGSPGTIARVIRGYVGDREGEEIFGRGPFDVLGRGYQRPMERATQRLFNMGAVLGGWRDLAPPDPELLTRLGGAVALRGRGTALRHADAGILDYVDLKAACAAVGAARALPPGTEGVDRRGE